MTASVFIVGFHDAAVSFFVSIFISVFILVSVSYFWIYLLLLSGDFALAPAMLLFSFEARLAHLIDKY